MAFCKNCGTLMENDVCPNCGTANAPAEPQPVYTAPAEPQPVYTAPAEPQQPTVPLKPTYTEPQQPPVAPPPPYGASQPPYGAYPPPYYAPHKPAAEPVTAGGWIWRSLLAYIPFVGWIIYLVMLFVWMGDESKEESFRNWAKAQLILLAISIGLVLLLFIFLVVLGFGLADLVSEIYYY